MRILRNKNQPPNTDLVSVYLQSSWDIVKLVYDNLDNIQEVADGISGGVLDGVLTEADIDTITKLNAILTDATLGDFASQGEAEAGSDNTKTMTPLRVAQAIASLSSGLKNNYNAALAPTVDDDVTEGYSPGSVWIEVVVEPHEAYRCVDNTDGAAVWILTSLTSDELAVVALSGDSDDLIEGLANLLMTVNERSKLAAIEDSATADMTGAEIKSAYEGESNTNAFTDAEKTKLGTVETDAKDDQTDTEIKTAYQTAVPLISQGDAEAGTATGIEGWSAERVSQAIAALGGGGGGGVAWTGSSITKSVASGTGTLFYDMAADVDADLPAAPALNDVVWLANNDDSAWDVNVDAGGGNEIVYLNSGFSSFNLAPGETCFLICILDSGPIRWGLTIFNSGNAGGGLTAVYKATDFTAVVGEKYFVNSSGGPIAVTLPAGDAQNNIKVMDVGHSAGTNNITLTPDGSETIDDDTSFVIDQDEGDVDITYLVGDTNWYVSADGSPNVINVPIAGPVITRTVRTLIETIDNTSTAAIFDFNNIPSGYDRLIVKGSLRSDVNNNFSWGHMFMNADLTESNYISQGLWGYDGVAYPTEASEPRMSVISGATSPANSYTQISTVIEDPDSSYLKFALTEFSALRITGGAYAGKYATTSVITAAITRLRVQADTDPTDKLFGTLTLYGEKDEEIGGGNQFEEINAQTGTSYEFTSGDFVDGVTAENASTSTYDVPDGLGRKGNVITLLNKGAGEVIITVAGSDTLGSTDNKCAEGKAISILKTDTTEWWVIGGSA